MTAVLFVIGLVVAALGIPGVLPWLQHRTPRKTLDVPLTDYIASLPIAMNPRSLVPPSSPSGVVRPPGPSPIMSLNALGAATKADIEDVIEFTFGVDRQSPQFGAMVKAARVPREDPPAPPPRPR